MADLSSDGDVGGWLNFYCARFQSQRLVCVLRLAHRDRDDNRNKVIW